MYDNQVYLLLSSPPYLSRHALNAPRTTRNQRDSANRGGSVSFDVNEHVIRPPPDFLQFLKNYKFHEVIIVYDKLPIYNIRPIDHFPIHCAMLLPQCIHTTPPPPHYPKKDGPPSYLNTVVFMTFPERRWLPF